jgi:predicted ATPase
LVSTTSSSSDDGGGGGGYLLVGKLDPLRRPEPYVGFRAAFVHFVAQVVQYGHDAIRAVQKALAGTGLRDRDWQVLTGMIPPLRRILPRMGVEEDEATTTTTTSEYTESDASPLDQKHNEQQQPDGAVKRFAYVFLMFLRAISSLGVPVILLLDDLHFADPSTLRIVANIVADLSHCPSLFLVVTLDDHDDGSSNSASVVSAALDTICAEAGCPVTRVPVGNVGRDDVASFLSDALNDNDNGVTGRSSKVAELASLVYEETKGNVFYMMAFVKYLLKNNLLRPTSMMGWQCNVTIQTIQISMALTCRSLSDFIMLQLEGLSTELLQLLKVASCCGAHLPVHLLQCIFGDDIVHLLREAAALELLTKDCFTEEYSFSHDLIQQVVYERMIPKDDRSQLHLEIGRRMRSAIKAEDLERSVYVLTAQFYFAKLLVTEPKEQCSVAQLCLMAGRKAAAASTIGTACVYLNLGIELLGECGWRDHYPLSLALYNAVAEMHLCIADFDVMGRLLEVTLKEARPSDRIQAEVTQVYALGIRNRQNEAVDFGIRLLARFGEALPRRIGAARLLLEAAKVYTHLRRFSDDQLLCLPTMKDPKKLACIQILNHLHLQAMLVRPKLTPFLALKATSLTLNHGQCLISPQAFAGYGVILGRIGQNDQAYRFGQLASKLLEKSGSDQSLPRVYAAIYGGINSIMRPITETISKLHEG